ncbi:neuropeptides capa receptor isoform X1 [Cryptotermes secundus]|uniref:neuropeptides capa receptor isoform X1 n=1 Tax=Cryptotermes secundus TaxID=105785 RepID=UPI000CD7AD60|nr:neuropeptides capa receptor isoform X1 [Cryptotermes secundus]
MDNLKLSRSNSSSFGANDDTYVGFVNESVEEYLVRMLGPKHLPLAVVLPITIIYVTIFVSGVVGNVAVCVVIARNKSMRTATNYYLFSLAVSDLTLLLLGLPYDLGVYWQQYPWVLGETLCKLRALGSEMSSYTSVLTIVAFSTERYLAICQPIHSYTTSSPRIALRVIVVLWCVSLLSAAPFAVYTKINYVEYPPGSSHQIAESAFCAMLDQALPSHWPMYEFSAFLFFLGPMLIIVVLYIRMGVTIHSRMIKFPGETKCLDSRTKPIIRMLVAVVITFFLCWAPFHMQRLFYIYGKHSPNFDKINEWAYYITGCFYFFSCTVNPVLYNVMSAKYRLAFRKTLCCDKADSGANREASVFRDTTVVYVNSHLDRCRSINNHDEEKRFRSLSRNSNDSDIPNNVLESVTLNNLQQDSSSIKERAQEHISTKQFDMLIDCYSTRERRLCQRCGSTSNQRHHCDEVSDLIVSVNASSIESGKYRSALLKI